MSLDLRLRWLPLLAAISTVTFSGCASFSETSLFGIASHRSQPTAPVAPPSQLAGPAPPVQPPPGGYNTQFASANYYNTQPRNPRRYSAPRPCRTGSG